jgi:hypothetical protein
MYTAVPHHLFVVERAIGYDRHGNPRHETIGWVTCPQPHLQPVGSPALPRSTARMIASGRGPMLDVVA